MKREAKLEGVLLRLLAERDAGKTICPSEVARAAAGSQERSTWEPLMDPVRAAARRLVAEGRVEATQRGRVVDLDTAKGPVRLRAKA